MDILAPILLGIVQGITEFLPISSSAHLIITREFFSIHIVDSMAFDAILQLATTLAVIIYFGRDLWVLLLVRNKKNNLLLGAIVIGTIPAVFLGFLFEDTIDQLFRNIDTVAWALIVGSTLFFIAERYAARVQYKAQEKDGEISFQQGLIIGFFQVLAFIPGMSRSGSTISGGLLLGLHRDAVVRFSFLLSVPILLGSGFKKLFDLSGVGGIDGTLIIASLSAFIAGFISIHFLIVYLRKHTLNLFIAYRIILAILIFVFF